VIPNGAVEAEILEPFLGLDLKIRLARGPKRIPATKAAGISL
jgi:hypothetical protein